MTANTPTWQASYLALIAQAMDNRRFHAQTIACANCGPQLRLIDAAGMDLADDSTLWGGEFLLVTEQGYQRYAHFRPFPLPGGAKAIQEPRRAALGLLYELYAERAFGHSALPLTTTFFRPPRNA
jgi:hydrogenase maturation protein HypF